MSKVRATSPVPINRAGAASCSQRFSGVRTTTEKRAQPASIQISWRLIV